jgi:hypothetical protein
LCNRAAKCIHLQVVREASAAVDLDDGQPLAVFGLERVVAADIDLAQLESELRLQVPQSSDRDLAEVAPLRVIDDDFGYGGYG